MTWTNKELPEQRRQLGRFRLFTLAIVVLVALVTVVLIALYYRAHFSWWYEAHRLELHDVQAISDRSMPRPRIPNDWLRCRVGAIEFSLPPELAANRSTQEGASSLVTFQHGYRAVVIALPTDAGELSDLLQTATLLCPKGQSFTMPRLRRACYQASSEDFRWSMTPEEVRWHAFCITTSNLIRPNSVDYTESHFREDLDGIIEFGGERAVFEWQSNDRRLKGYMHFVERRNKTDSNWIRAVCQSLKVSNEADVEDQKPSAETAASPHPR